LALALFSPYLSWLVTSRHRRTDTPVGRFRDPTR